MTKIIYTNLRNNIHQNKQEKISQINYADLAKILCLRS